MGILSAHDRVVFLVAHGFDELVTVQLARFLRRYRVPVWLVGLDSELVTGQWLFTMRPDVYFADLDSGVACPLLVLPGPAACINRLLGNDGVAAWIRFVLEGNYVAAPAAAEAALPNITFPDWQAHYLPQGSLSLASYGRLLTDHVWHKAGLGVSGGVTEGAGV